MNKIEFKDGIVYAKVNHHFAQDDIHEIIDAVEENSAKATLLDFSQYDTILQSSAIGMLISLHRDLKEIDVPVGLCGMHKHNVAVFEMAGLDKIVKVYKTIKDGENGITTD